MACKGSTTLFIGRREREGSPISTTPEQPGANQPASSPASSLAVVPLLPQSMVTGPTGGPAEGDIFKTPSSRATTAPRACTAARLDRVSSQSSQPMARQGPLAISPSRAARCEMDLSPGTATFPRRGPYARDSSLVRVSPPGRRGHPSVSGSPRCAVEMSVMMFFSSPTENLGDRATSPLIETPINVSYPKPM